MNDGPSPPISSQKNRYFKTKIMNYYYPLPKILSHTPTTNSSSSSNNTLNKPKKYLSSLTSDFSVPLPCPFSIKNEEEQVHKILFGLICLFQITSGNACGQLHPPHQLPTPPRLCSGNSTCIIYNENNNNITLDNPISLWVCGVILFRSSLSLYRITIFSPSQLG